MAFARTFALVACFSVRLSQLRNVARDYTHGSVRVYRTP
jgi:hypothetical protein